MSDICIYNVLTYVQTMWYTPSMLYTNVRGLLRHFDEQTSKITKSEPLIVTKYGKPFLKIEKFEPPTDFAAKGKELAEKSAKFDELKKEFNDLQYEEVLE